MPGSPLTTRFADRPIRLTENPVRTFYEGGRLWRQFRGSPEPRDDRWAEDWVGSCIQAGQPTPDGRAQGLSMVDLPDGRRLPLRSLLQADPRVQVKLVAPRARVPLHTHPDAEFALRHFGSSCGKAEAWILLETPGTDGRPASAGIGFREGVTEEQFLAAVQAQDSAALLELVHTTTIKPGDVVFVRPGVPHYISGGTFLVEVQEPADLGVLAEWRGFVDNPAAAAGGLDLATALACFRIEPQTRRDALGEAFQRPQTIRRAGAGREVALLEEAALPFFEARQLELDESYEPEDGRYYVGVVLDGAGLLEGSGWREPIRRGDTFACPAALAHRYLVDKGPLRVIRALGPVTEAVTSQDPSGETNRGGGAQVVGGNTQEE
jgi:mannose-6-phosphate isomerase